MLAITIRGVVDAFVAGTLQLVFVSVGLVVSVLAIRFLGSMAVGHTADARRIDEHARYSAGELARGTGMASAALYWIVFAPQVLWPVDEWSVWSVLGWLAIGTVIGVAIAVVVGHARLHKVARSLFP